MPEPHRPPAGRGRTTRWLLGAWVVGCLLLAGVVVIFARGGDGDSDTAAPEPSTPSASEPSVVDADPPVSRPGEPADTPAEEPSDEEAAAPETTVAPLGVGQDADGDGAIADDLDADGDGVLDDWVSPDATIDQYQPGETAVDGEYEEDRRAAAGCEPAYTDVCVPPAPPILTCAEADAWNIVIESADPHGFDTDGDGIGCETSGEGEEPLPPELDPPPHPG